MASPQDIIISIGLNCQYNLLISFSVVRMPNAEREERKERTNERKSEGSKEKLVKEKVNFSAKTVY